MKIKITIDCDNAAFADGNNGSEVARILREAAERIDGDDIPSTPTRKGDGYLFLRDYNGNRVGEMKVTR